MAIDLRMQSAAWIHDLVERGGKVEIEDVRVRRLDEIAAKNDLTIVAAGRSEMTKLFPRDEARSRISRTAAIPGHVQLQWCQPWRPLCAVVFTDQVQLLREETFEIVLYAVVF